MRTSISAITGLLFAALAGASTGAEPEELSCASHSATSAAINECLTAALNASKNELMASVNSLGKTVMAVQRFQLPRQPTEAGVTMKTFVAAQQAWEEFRERHCTFMSALIGPVGDAQQEKTVCGLRMTRARDAELREETQFWREKYPNLDFK